MTLTFYGRSFFYETFIRLGKSFKIRYNATIKVLVDFLLCDFDLHSDLDLHAKVNSINISMIGLAKATK